MATAKRKPEKSTDINSLTRSFASPEVNAPGQGHAYPRRIVEQARAMWASGMYKTDGEIEEMLGIKKGILTVWRNKSKPDGKDWYELKETIGGTNPIRDTYIGDDVEVLMRSKFLDMSTRVLSRCISALDDFDLYDENKVKVEFLYDRDGKRVKLGGIRPTNMTQVISGISEMGKLAGSNLERLNQLNADKTSQEEALIGMVRNIFSQMDLTQEQRIQMLEIINRGNDGTDGQSLIGLTFETDGSPDELVEVDEEDIDDGEFEEIGEEEIDEIVLDDDDADEADGEEWVSAEEVDDEDE